MESKAIVFFKVAGMSLLYVILVFLPSFLGFSGPKFWVFFPVVSAFVGAFAYFYIAGRWQNFGVATLLSLLFVLFLLLTGESDPVSLPIALALGIVSDIVRVAVGRNSLRAVRLAYPFLSLSTVVWLLPLWTKTEWYLSAAIEEMGTQDYADGLSALANPLILVLMLVLVVCAAWLGISVSARIMRKSSEHFKP